MEWSDMTDQDSHQDDWILEQQRENLDIETFMQKPSNFDSFTIENDSDYYSTFPSTGPKQMFKVTSYSSSKTKSQSQSESHSPIVPSLALAENENKGIEDNSLNIIGPSEGFKLPQQNSFNSISMSMSISERMKYKKEKAKQLLEKKYKKEEVLTSINQHETTIPINEDEDLINGNECTNSNDNAYEPKLNKKTQRDSTVSGDNNNLIQVSNEKALTKKEIKMLRNRASAQRSRDRRKKEFDELHSFTRNIQIENEQLKAELAKRDKEMELIKDKIKSLCCNCKESFSFFTWESKCQCADQDQDSNHGRISIVDSSNTNNKLFANGNNNKKYSLISGLFVILCVIGSIAIYTKTLTQSHTNSNSNVNVNPTANGNRLLQEKALPFEIVKDYSKRKAKEIEFLNQKRKQFLIKEYNPNEMKVNIIHENNQRVQKDEDVNMKEEDDIRRHNDVKLDNVSTSVVPLSFYEEKQDIKSLYCKDFITSNEKNHDLFKQLFQSTSSHNDSSNDSKTTPMSDEYVSNSNDINTLSKELNLRHNFDLKQHIKELTNDNSEAQIDEKTTLPSKDLILHMIIPTESHKENQNVSKNINKGKGKDKGQSKGNDATNSNTNSNSFYEVGCKIFEINKIYKD